MAMKKFINDPTDLTAELLEGYVQAYSDKVALKSGKLVVRAAPKPQDKVAIVTLGGAGHEPALSGFVGYGMLDISVVGDIFAAPGPLVPKGAGCMLGGSVTASNTCWSAPAPRLVTRIS